MSEIKKPLGKITMYCTGGCGINIGSQLITDPKNEELGFAKVTPVFIDTSKSNLNKLPKDSPIYLIESDSRIIDGGGKVRASNYEEIRARNLDILNKYKPGDLSIILHSASGGSGSVIANELLSELLNRKVPVMMMTVGSSDTLMELNNTVKTLKSFENTAKVRNAPVSMIYYENSEDTPRKVVDSNLINTVAFLAALYSRQNEELDSADLANWLGYDKVTSFKPGLTVIGICDSKIEATPNQVVVSVATLTNDSESFSTGLDNVEYQCVGILPESVRALLKKTTPIHFAIFDGIVNEMVKKHTTRLKNFNESMKARVSRDSFLTTDDVSEDSGVIL